MPRDMQEHGSRLETLECYLVNQTGGDLVEGDVVSMNDLGTNSTYDTVDDTENDVDGVAVAIVAADINTRKRVAAGPIKAGALGRFYEQGRIPVKVASLAATAVMGARLTTSSAAADGSTIVAKQLHARLDNSGTGPLNAITAVQMCYGITKEGTTSSAAVVICDFYGNGDFLVGV